MTYRWWYRRDIRTGRVWERVRLWVRRMACGHCGVSHAILPLFCLFRRLDPVDVIGGAIGDLAAGRGGVRTVAARLGLPATTVRSWWRRFRRHVGDWYAGAVAVAATLGIEIVPGPVSPVTVVGVFDRIADRLDVGDGWATMTMLCGGRLLASATSPLLRMPGGSIVMWPTLS